MVLNGAFISSNHWAKQGFFKISDFGYLKMLNSISCTSLKRTPFKSYCVTFFWQNGPVFDLTFWLLLLLKNIYFSINKNKVLPWVLCRRGGGESAKSADDYYYCQKQPKNAWKSQEGIFKYSKIWERGKFNILVWRRGCNSCSLPQRETRRVDKTLTKWADAVLKRFNYLTIGKQPIGFQIWKIHEIYLNKLRNGKHSKL